MLARIENGAIVELRAIAISDVPPHKQDRWLPVEGDAPPIDPAKQVLIGPEFIVEAGRVRRSFKIETHVPSLADFEAAIEDHLTRAAASRGYKSEASILSYVPSTNAVWAAEARAFAAWRDEVWAKAYEILAGVQSGTRAPPDLAAFLNELPALRWPE